jgi:hypothetical protein
MRHRIGAELLLENMQTDAIGTFGLSSRVRGHASGQHGELDIGSSMLKPKAIVASITRETLEIEVEVRKLDLEYGGGGRTVYGRDN